jgi:hypothetical protein
MSRASWMLVGGVVLALVACANGSLVTEPELPGEDAGAPSEIDSGIVSDDGATTEDASARGSEDSASPVSEDTGVAPGDDASSENDASGGDSSQPEADSGEDASVADAGEDTGTTTIEDSGHDSGTTPPEDAGHDSGTATVDAGHDSGTTVDAGHDSGTTAPDAGHDSGTTAIDAGEDAGCSPTTPTFTKTFHPPTTSGICNGAQISAFYTACLAGTTAACTTWQGTGSNSSCNSCLTGSSSPTSADWGPYVYYTTSGIEEIDLGACLYDDLSATGSDSNIISCSDDLEYLMECEHAACDTSCSGDTSTAAYTGCQTSADSTVCLAEYNAVYATGAACSKVDSACFTGTDFESGFTAVATVMCD